MKIIPTVILVIELVSLKMLYSEATIEAGLLKPSLEKIALLVCFLTFAPTPMFLMFQTGYLPIVHFILSMLMDMKNIKPVDLLSAAPALGVFLLFSSLFGFAYYVIICLMQRRAVLRVSLLLTTAFMIITAATQKVYETSGEGTDTPESTAIELYSSLFPEAKEPDRTKEPLPFVLPPVRGKEDMGPPEIQPVPVAPSTIKRMPENSYQQKGKSIRPGYDIERQFYTEEQKEPSGH
ncbi:MAG: hypothetical protein HGA78_03540 [Nitrospirales bacterium]|nr:hypothetical protein [Nitrospirales bacterium]